MKWGSLGGESTKVRTQSLAKSLPSGSGLCVQDTPLVCVMSPAVGKGIIPEASGGCEPQAQVGSGSQFQGGLAHRDSQGLLSRFCCRFDSPVGGAALRRPSWAFPTPDRAHGKESHGTPCRPGSAGLPVLCPVRGRKVVSPGYLGPLFWDSCPVLLHPYSSSDEVSNRLLIPLSGRGGISGELKGKFDLVESRYCMTFLLFIKG